MAGRLICQDCGLAAGSRPTRTLQQRGGGSNATKRWRWFALLVILAITVVVLMA